MGSSEDALGCAEVRANRAHVTNRDPNVFSISEPWSMMGGCPPTRTRSSQYYLQYLARRSIAKINPTISEFHFR